MYIGISQYHAKLRLKEGAKLRLKDENAPEKKAQRWFQSPHSKYKLSPIHAKEPSISPFLGLPETNLETGA